MKKKVSMYNGKLNINGFELQCAVLEDKTRVIGKSSVLKLFGINQRGWHKDRKKMMIDKIKEVHNIDVSEIPVLMSDTTFLRYLDKETIEMFHEVHYTSHTGNKKIGYNAILIPKICDLFLMARRDGALDSRKIHLAEKSEFILSALAKIGITALIDEATGYQYERENNALEKLLSQYISEDLMKWQKRFPDKFYREIFRLNDWDYNIKSINQKRPSIVGKWTNRLIYDFLPNEVVLELRRRTPKSARLHQNLTEDIGHAQLDTLIKQALVIFKISKDMNDVWDMLDIIKESDAKEVNQRTIVN